MIIDSPKVEKGKIFFSQKISSKKISVIYQFVADVLKLFEDRGVRIDSVLICGYTNADDEIKIPKYFDVKIEFEEPEEGIDLFELDRNVADIFKYRKVLEICHEKEENDGTKTERL